MHLPSIIPIRRQSILKLLAACLLLAVFFPLYSLPSAQAQDQTPLNFTNLNDWPLDDRYRTIIAYPDSAWTWQMLGLNAGQTCPPYRLRGRENSQPYWRDPALPEDLDWAAASQGNNWLACYAGHAGTDIAAQPGAPVYAAADGTILLADSRPDDPEGGVALIEHYRVVAGTAYRWVARYAHLAPLIPVTHGFVREGQMIGTVQDQASNTHLHFEIEGLFDCVDQCLLSPWGPTYLWMDDDFNHLPDPAAAVLKIAPTGMNLIRNPGFRQGLDRWLMAGGIQAGLREEALWITRPEDTPGAAVEQVIAYRFRAGTPVTLRLSLGNASPITRYVSLSLRSIQGYAGVISQTFSLPPRSALAEFTLSGVIKSGWSNAILSISVTPADGIAGVAVDDLSLTTP
jgi:murein DD-endopeptidase MepM/ murein hydrolase activator NlpD